MPQITTHWPKGKAEFQTHTDDCHLDSSAGYPVDFYSTSLNKTLPSSPHYGPCQNSRKFLGFFLHFRLNQLSGSVMATFWLVLTSTLFPPPRLPKSLTWTIIIDSYCPTCTNHWSPSSSIMHEL